MTIRELLLRGYWRMEQAVAPGVRYSQSVYEDVLSRHVGATTEWLDLGCGRRILPPWRADAERDLVSACRQLVGVDVDRRALMANRSMSLKCQASADRLPFADGSFDLVTANMVVEHLEDPVTQFHEISRVMRPGGLLIFHTPNALGYPTLLARVVPDVLKGRLAYYLDGRGAESVYPTFYRANTRSALEAVASASRLHILDLRLVVTTAVFAVVLPIAFFELLWLRLLTGERLRSLRTNIIAVLQKPETPSA
jgi:SAM-dependent methyltransferase